MNQTSNIMQVVHQDLEISFLNYAAFIFSNISCGLQGNVFISHFSFDLKCLLEF